MNICVLGQNHANPFYSHQKTRFRKVCERTGNSANKFKIEINVHPQILQMTTNNSFLFISISIVICLFTRRRTHVLITIARGSNSFWTWLRYLQHRFPRLGGSIVATLGSLIVTRHCTRHHARLILKYAYWKLYCVAHNMTL